MLSVKGAADRGGAIDGDEKLLVATGAAAIGVSVSANVGAASNVWLLDRLVCVLVVLGI